MVNKKGFVRIAELLIAIILISTIWILSYKQTTPKQETQDFSELARDILAEISTLGGLRDEIILNQENVLAMVETKIFIDSRLPNYIRFELRACSLSSACGQASYVGNVYSAERIISTSQDNSGPIFKPIKLRLFLWVEE